MEKERKKRIDAVEREERIYRPELTEEELGIVMCALSLYASNWCATEEAYNTTQNAMKKLEEAM